MKTALPATRNLAPFYILSIILAVLVAAVSIAGLLYPDTLYPTQELYQSFVPNDVVNLAVGLPILLGSLALARRGRLLGLLFWPGTLLYIFYSYLPYLLSAPVSITFLGYLTLVTLSLYALAGLVASIDGQAVRQRLEGAVPERFAGGVLVGFGLLFALRVVAVITGAWLNQTPIPAVEQAVHIADFLLAPACITGGVMLWRRHAFGYLTAPGLLFQTSMLFVALIGLMVVQPALTSASFPVADVVIVALMWVVFSIPLILFLRGMRTTASAQ